MRNFALAAGLIVLAAAGCGADAAQTRGNVGRPPAGPPTVPVTGQVTRSCVGPLVLGAPRRCSDRAVFQRPGRRMAVSGRFSIRLRPGRYRVSVDTCSDQQTLNVKRAIARLKLAPRCELPL